MATCNPLIDVEQSPSLPFDSPFSKTLATAPLLSKTTTAHRAKYGVPQLMKLLQASLTTNEYRSAQGQMLMRLVEFLEQLDRVLETG